jgi:hypothetical protein
MVRFIRNTEFIKLAFSKQLLAISFKLLAYQFKITKQIAKYLKANGYFIASSYFEICGGSSFFKVLKIDLSE